MVDVAVVDAVLVVLEVDDDWLDVVDVVDAVDVCVVDVEVVDLEVAELVVLTVEPVDETVEDSVSDAVELEVAVVEGRALAPEVEVDVCPVWDEVLEDAEGDSAGAAMRATSSPAVARRTTPAKMSLRSKPVSLVRFSRPMKYFADVPKTATPP